MNQHTSKIRARRFVSNRKRNRAIVLTAATVPLLALIGPLLLGSSVGDDARDPLIILLVAFAIDGFYFVLYQVYLRVRHERLLLGTAILELATMAIVTILLRDEGALAPAYGQLAARVVVCVVVIVPVGLAAIGRCSWFDRGR